MAIKDILNRISRKEQVDDTNLDNYDTGIEQTQQDVETELLAQEQNREIPLMMQGVDYTERPDREPILERDAMFKTEKAFNDAINTPGVVESGQISQEEFDRLQGNTLADTEKSLEIKPPKSRDQLILEEIQKIRKGSDDEIKSSKTMDAIGNLLNVISPMIENRQRARAIRSAQSLGADPGSLNMPRLATDNASKMLAERRAKINELIQEQKLMAALQPKTMSKLDEAKIREAEAKAKMYESKANPSTNPLLEKKMQTEELRQQELRTKQAQSKAQIQGNLDKIDEQINDLTKADVGLKKGGITGLVDNTLGKWWDMARGNEDQMTRQLLNKIETQITLMGSGSLKGAISDKEIDLLKQEVPSKFGDEKNWRNWIKPRIELLQKARKNVASQLSEGRPEESSMSAQPPVLGKQIARKQYSASRNQTKIIYADGTEEIVDGKQ